MNAAIPDRLADRAGHAGAGPFSISIVMPAYNVAELIEETLATILPQMRACHELVLIDDGSTDATMARARAACAAWPQHAIRIVSQARAGVADARNQGVARARGDYILFIDSDDLLQAGALDGIDAAISAGAPDAIATDFCIWYPERSMQPLEHHRLSYPPGTTVRGHDAILSAYFADRHMYVWSKIIRREIYMRLGLPLFPSGRLFEDMAAVPRLLAACRTLAYVPLELLHYRQHPSSITRRVTPRWCIDYVLALESARPHLERAGVGAAVRAQFDIAACHFYMCAVKTSFQLPADIQPQRVRKELRAIFLRTLFGSVDEAIANMASGRLLSANRRSDERCVRQLRHALADDRLFQLRQTVNRFFKNWQNMRQLRRSRTT